MTEIPSPSSEPASGPPSGGSTNDGSSQRRQRLFRLAALVIGVVLAAVLVATVGGGDDESGTGDDIDPWNAVAAIHADSGEVTIYGPDGDEIETVDTGFEATRGVSTRGQYALVLASGDSEAAAIIDTSTGEITWDREPSIDGGSFSWLATTTEPVVIESVSEGGNAILIDPETGDEIDFGKASEFDEPLFLPYTVFRLDDEPTFAATTVGSRSRTVIVAFGDDDPIVVDGSLAALRDGDVLFTENEDGATRLSFMSLDDPGEPVAGPSFSGLRGARLAGDDTAVVLADDGTMLRAEAGDDEPTEIATLDVDDGYEVRFTVMPPGVERIVVSLEPTGEDDADDVASDSSDGTDETDTTDGATDTSDEPPDSDDGEPTEQTVVYDLDGNELGRVDGWPRFANFNDGIRCTATDDDDTIHLIDLETGDELGSAAGDGGTPPTASADGCTVGVIGDGRETTTVLAEAGEVTIDHWTQVVAPDGTAALARLDDESIGIVDLGDPDAEPVEIDGVIGAAFVTR